MTNTRTTASWANDRRRNKGEHGEERQRNATIPLSPPEEKAFLVGVGPNAVGEGVLDELAELARTAGARVVGRLVQRRTGPEPASYLGSGKLEELIALCGEAEATLVIADSDLSPAQVRNMEKAVDLRVIDRSELIIDIFATHARTQQARLQVELAQLKYLAPRLKRMWTHLSRITGAGGIGSRGPGEKQIEVDRRIIQRRLRDLAQELRTIEGRRDRLVESRESLFKVALVGYTNAGKSTLMRALTGSDVFVADQLFATLDTRTRRWSLDAHTELLLSDTVGFIEKLPHHLVASFHATLAEVREANVLIHVVDAADPHVEHKIGVVREVLEKIGAREVPEVLVLNKCDLLADPVEATILSGHVGGALPISARTGRGFDELAAALRSRATAQRQIVNLSIPAGDGKTLALIARVGTILSREFEGETARITASLPSAWVGHVAAFVEPTSSP